MGNAIARCKHPVHLTANSNCYACVDINAGSRGQVVSRSPSSSCTGLGTRYFHLTVRDCRYGRCDYDSCSGRVTVTDRTAPTIVDCPTSSVLTADSQCTAPIPGFLIADAKDNCDASVVARPSETRLDGLGTHAVVFSATDSSGNTESRSCPVTVVDTSPPIVTACPDDLELVASVGCTAVLPSTFTATATDNCDGTVTEAYPVIDGPLPLGSHDIVFSATDGSGNTGRSTCTTKVSVIDPDDDGVCGDDDLCPDTNVAGDKPDIELKKNHWMLSDQKTPDGFFIFRTSGPSFHTYTTRDTAGCSCRIIITECSYGKGLEKFGCTNGIMDAWTGLYNNAGDDPFQCDLN